MWTATILLVDSAPKSSFKEAFKEIFDSVMKEIAAGNASYGMLETYWIKSPSGGIINFHNARDIAAESGFVKNGKWVD